MCREAIITKTISTTAKAANDICGFPMSEHFATYVGLDEGRCEFLMKYKRGVTLHSWMEKCTPLVPLQLFFVLLEVAALLQSEFAGFRHPDDGLHPDNILVNTNTRGNDH
jgi:hypothetical protein